MRPTNDSIAETHTDLAQHVAWLEQILKPGYSLVRTKRRWYLRKFDSYFNVMGIPRMGWQDVDSSPSLATLLDRLAQ
jgi:hypothetical protein